MKKRSLLIVFLVLVGFIGGIALAQDQVLPEKAPLPELPDPGLKPGDFFYFLDQWLEAIREFFTFNTEAKALLQTERALERIAEIKALLAEKGVAAPGLDVALSKIRSNMKKATKILEEQKAKGKDIKQLARVLDDHFDARENLLKEVFKIEKEKLKAKEKDIKNQIREARLAGNFDKVAELEVILADIKVQKEVLEREKDRQEEILEAEEEKLEALLEAKEKELEDLEEEEEDLFEQREKDLEREFEQREKDLGQREKALEIDLKKAIKEGNTELANQIRTQLQDLKNQKEALEAEKEAAEEELEREEEKAEQITRMSEKAQKQIREAEEEISEAKEEMAELKEVPNAITVLLGEAEDKLNRAKTAFEEGKFGEAFGQAMAAERLARNAERKIEQQEEIEEELEEKEEKEMEGAKEEEEGEEEEGGQKEGKQEGKEKKKWPPEGVTQNTYNLTSDFAGLCTEIFDEEKGKGPKVGGERRGGSTDCSYSWNSDWVGKPERQEHGCKCEASVSNVTVDAEITVTLPKWEGYDSASEKAKTKWDKFVENVKEHEEGHVKICKEGVDKIKDAIEGAGPGTGSGETCEQACNAAAEDLDAKVQATKDSAAKEVEKEQEEYDTETNHGKTQGATLDCTDP